jgi:hypothetical protein
MRLLAPLLKIKIYKSLTKINFNNKIIKWRLNVHSSPSSNLQKFLYGEMIALGNLVFIIKNKNRRVSARTRNASLYQRLVALTFWYSRYHVENSTQPFLLIKVTSIWWEAIYMDNLVLEIYNNKNFLLRIGVELLVL